MRRSSRSGRAWFIGLAMGRRIGPDDWIDEYGMDYMCDYTVCLFTTPSTSKRVFSVVGSTCNYPAFCVGCLRPKALSDSICRVQVVPDDASELRGASC